MGLLHLLSCLNIDISGFIFSIFLKSSFGIVSGSPNVAVILVYVWFVMNTLGTIVLTTRANVCIIFPLVMVDLTKDMHLVASLHFGSLSLGR